MSRIPQIVPSNVCLSCEVCCRFPEQTSSLRPYFSEGEIELAIERGVSAVHFSDPRGCQVDVVPHPSGEGYLCPAFDPQTSHCRIYEVRPLDCQIYPFVLMWDQEHQTVLLGWDTKCPFLFTPNEETPQPLIVSNLAVFPDLSAEIMVSAERLASELEEGAFTTNVVEHPNLVTAFQDDVVVIQPLPLLTRAIGVEKR